MAARVVFSDGSKAMAHNLDDRYQRWMLRREEVAQEGERVRPDTAIDLFVPELPEAFVDHVEVRERLELLKQKQLFLQVRNSEINLRWQNREIVKGEYELERAPIALASTRVQAQLVTLKQILDGARRVEKRANLDALKVKAAISRTEAQKVITLILPKEADGTITAEEQIALANARTVAREAMLDGMAQQATDGRNEKTELYIEKLKGEITSLQAKLIAAYERIIELQACAE